MTSKTKLKQLEKAWKDKRATKDFDGNEKEFTDLISEKENIETIVFDGFDEDNWELYWNLLHQAGLRLTIPEEGQLNKDYLVKLMQTNYSSHGADLDLWEVL